MARRCCPLSLTRERQTLHGDGICQLHVGKDRRKLPIVFGWQHGCSITDCSLALRKAFAARHEFCCLLPDGGHVWMLVFRSIWQGIAQYLFLSITSQTCLRPDPDLLAEEQQEHHAPILAMPQAAFPTTALIFQKRA